MSKEKDIWGLTPFGDEKFSITPDHAKHLSETKQPPAKKSPIQPNQKIKQKTSKKPTIQVKSSPSPKTSFVEEFSKEHYSTNNSIIKHWKMIIENYLSILKCDYFIILNISEINPDKEFIRLFVHPNKLHIEMLKKRQIIKAIEINLIEEKTTQLFLQTNLITNNENLKTNSFITPQDLKYIHDQCNHLKHNLNHNKAFIISISSNSTHKHAIAPLNPTFTRSILQTANITFNNNYFPINMAPIIGNYFLESLMNNQKKIQELAQ